MQAEMVICSLILTEGRITLINERKKNIEKGRTVNKKLKQYLKH